MKKLSKNLSNSCFFEKNRVKFKVKNIFLGAKNRKGGKENMFGDALRMILLKKKITTTELAKKVGLSQSAISNILRETRGTKKETFNKIVDALELPKKEQFELKKAYSYDVIDVDILKYFQDLEQENEKLKNIIEAIQLLKK